MKVKKRKSIALTLVMVLVSLFAIQMFVEPTLALADYGSANQENASDSSAVDNATDVDASDKDVVNEGLSKQKTSQNNINARGGAAAIIDVVVPAIWYPVDKDTNKVIKGLTPKITYPGMFPRSEVARMYDGSDIYQIDLMGTPKPKEPGSWSANNFMYTSNLWFTDKFHRVVAQAYGTYELDGGGGNKVSSVRKVKYGSFEAEAKFDDTLNDFVGLHGSDRAPYQEGKTMEIYIATKTKDVSLSEPSFKTGDVIVKDVMSDETVRDTLIDHVEKVEYVYLPETLEAGAGETKELDLSALDTLFLYQYNSDDSGDFIKSGSDYINFMSESFVGLPEGKYEAVYPIYWDRDIPDYLSSPDTFSRNRYKFEDTFHFTFEVKKEATSTDNTKDDTGLTNTNDDANQIKTGDESSIYLWISILLVAALGIFTLKDRIIKKH